MATTYDPHRKVDAVIPFRREYKPFKLPLTGTGYLAGTFPNGLTTIEGNPTPATVRVLYRPESGHPGDGAVVAEVQSNQDGTWIVEGLNPDLKYDVVGRLKDFNDVIMSNISPVVADEIRWVGNLEWDGVKVAGMLRFTGGVGPYSVTSVNGLPAGLTPELLGNELTIVGDPTEWGEFTGVIGVKDSGSLTADVVVRLVVFDPYWDQVVSLLHFDGDLTDEKGNLFIEQGGALLYSQSPDPAFNEEVVFGAGWLEIGASDDFNLGFEDFTIEGFITMNAFDKPWGAVISSGESSYSQVNQTVTVPGNGEPGSRTVRLINRLHPTANPLVATSTLMETGVRYHFAITRESGVFRAFLNGTLEGSRTVSAVVDFSNSGTLIGRNKWDGNNGMLNGNIDELRITKGVARYTEDFDPPTAPFPNFGPPA